MLEAAIEASIRRPTFLVASSALLVFAGLVAGCGKSKVDQCNAFIERANASQTVVAAVHLDSEDPAAIEAAAAKVDVEAKGVADVKLEDAKLVELKTKYSASLTAFAKTARDLAAIVKASKDAKGAAGLDDRLKKLEADAEKAEKDESKVVDEVNVYCTGSK
ncbi:MAG: hypothetical protein U0169_19195 [Polyangiaceae bacterium]